MGIFNPNDHRAIEFRLNDWARSGEPLTFEERETLNKAADELIGLRNRLAAALRKNRKLSALEASGVDNWEGYEEAMRCYELEWPSDFGDPEDR